MCREKIDLVIFIHKKTGKFPGLFILPDLLRWTPLTA